MRRRLTDLFKKIYSKVKNAFSVLNRPSKAKYEAVKVKEFTPERKKPPSKWVLSHNEIQAKNANALRKRRKKNKAASKSRKINY